MNVTHVVSFPAMFGVFWAVWDVYGFWWGVLYGMFWQFWIPYRLAEFFLR